MADSFEVGTYGDGWHFDANLGEDVRDFTVAFSTKGKVMTSTTPSEFEVGGRGVVRASHTVHIPVDTPVVPRGASVRSTISLREFRVLAEVTHPQPKSRRFAVGEVLG